MGFMRERKYKFWDKHNKVWVGPYTLKQLADEDAFSYDREVKAICSKWDDFDSVEYTGIKDHKSQEIYDGDIIKITGIYGKIEYAKVIWGPVNNMYTWMNGETWLLHFAEGVEGPLYPYCQPHHGYEVSVAGNIYENPELLKR